MATIIERCLDKNADRRFQAMEEVLAALKDCPHVNAIERVSKTTESLDQQQIRDVVGRIEYKNVARSRQALIELERILHASPDTQIRESINRGLRELGTLSHALHRLQGEPPIRRIRRSIRNQVNN
jgi:hypothetical protein